MVGNRCSRNASARLHTRTFTGEVLKAESRQSFGRFASKRFVVTAAAPTTFIETHPDLADIDLVPFISDKGRVMPHMLPRTAATVFAVFGEDKEVQYIGFSKDIRNTLRQLLARRPDQCHYVKTWDVQNLDQKRMMAARQAWIKEVGAPVGNGKAQADSWSTAPNLKLQPQAAALAEETVAKLRERGLTEDYSADVEALKKGIFQIQESTLMTDAELDADDERRAEAAANTFAVEVPIGDQTVAFTIFFATSFPTNNGFLFDVHVTYDERETMHRVLVSSEWETTTGRPLKEVVQTAFAFLLTKEGVGRRIEGLMGANEFPINYFSMSEVEQWFPDFADFLGKVPESYWRFNRIGDYNQNAAQNDPTQGIPLLGPGGLDSDEEYTMGKWGKLEMEV